MHPMAEPRTDRPRTRRDMMPALALVVGIAMIFAVEYLDNSIREPEEVEQLLGAPVVGIIPQANARTLRTAHRAA